ncbi:MAG: hypothetical protein RIR66_1095 [Actinomycetota bacterium]|jgi:riboflavin-specific deaminase-like protein
MELDLTGASVSDLANFYALPSDQVNWLRANMVMSKDGHFVDETGSSKGLSSPLDLKVLLTLRALSDAILVGANTVRIEDYKVPKLAGDYQHLNTKPAKLVVVSNSLNFDLTARMFSDPSNKPLIITSYSSDLKWIEKKAKLESVCDFLIWTGPIDFAQLIMKLNELGYHQIVCEGGEQLLVELLAQNLIDELDITYSPVSLGNQARTTPLTNAIASWPNRITAKLGSDQVARIKR